MSNGALLLVRGARVLTMDPRRPAAQAVLCDGGLIAGIGDESKMRAQARALGRDAEEFFIPGATIVPAFIDAHIHLLATAARLLSVDCSPGAVSSIAGIQGRIAERTAHTAPGEWVRAAGYDEFALEERRHPTRYDLDLAAPAHPVRLLHRGGHACVLNSRALALAGIDGSTPEPPGGFMDRDLASGEPTGLLIEMNELVDAAVPALAYSDLAAAVREVSRELLGGGITCVHDAGAANDHETWHTLSALAADGSLGVGLTMMRGADAAPIDASGAPPGLRCNGVKLQPRELEHELWPPYAELAARVAALAADGEQLAVHATTRAAVDAILAGYAAAGQERVSAQRHRIEHGGIFSERSAARAAEAGALVVTQPGFLYWNGDLMRARIAEDDLPDLYPLRRLLDARVLVAGSSDSPVAPAAPLLAMRAAVERRTRSGVVLNPEQRITGAEALALFTRNAAFAMHLEHERGWLAPGMAAELVLLSGDPTSPSCDWDSLRVLATIRAGELVSGGSGGQANA